MFGRMIEEQRPPHDDKISPQDVSGDGISTQEENPTPQRCNHAELDYVGGHERGEGHL